MVPDESPIFYACENGDIDEILQLVQTGIASVFDTTQRGFNLIHVRLPPNISLQNHNGINIVCSS